MAEASFYILPSESPLERHIFACKLIEKAYRSGFFCYVLTDSDEQSQLMDDLLWTFRAGSFIPHEIYTGQPPEFEKTVLIGTLNAPEHWQKTLFNLSSRFPELGTQTERILEILDNDEMAKAEGRKRYAQYKQSGVKVTIHKDW